MAPLTAVDLAEGSATTFAAPANPLDLLPLRQLFLFTAAAHGRSITEAAAVLDISRETAHSDLRAARATLVLAPSPRATVHPIRPKVDDLTEYTCRRHAGDCPKGCGTLQIWLARFNSAHPVRR